MMRIIVRWIGAILGVSLLFGGSVQAQSTPETYAVLSAPSPQDFPTLQPMLKVFSRAGRFVHGLSKSDIQLYENGIAVPLQAVKEQRVGVQVVFVLNPGVAFLVRDSQGNTRYDDLLNGLVDWARRRLGSTIDDLSILVTDGPSRSHLSNPLELFYTLASYRVSGDATPSLDSLIKGIEIAADPSPREGMERLVIFITAPLSGDQSLAIQNAVQQAQQAGVRIVVWLVSTAATTTPQAIDALRPLADETQGRLWVLNKPEDQPDPETILEPLRDVYLLQYVTSPAGGNERQLEAEVQIGDEVIRSQPVSFRIDLQPPNLVFLAPPAEIVREPPQTVSRIAEALQAFEPQSYHLSLLIEFPDGRPRSIVKLRAYVDQQLILEQLEPPFDRFVWNLQEYTQSGQHVLQAEIVDEFGMTAKTVPTPVLVKINRPLPAPSRMLSRNLLLVVLTFVSFTAAFLALVSVLRGQLVPTSQRLSRRLGMRKKQPLDPLTQPVPIPPLPPLRTGAYRSGEPRSSSPPSSKPPVLALLYRLGESTEGEPKGPFAMVTDVLPIGRNATQNLLVIDDPTVEGLHARLERQTDGKFRLYDLGSLMGTWVNYTPVSQEGVTVEDGDLIHIGRVGFRFHVRESSLQASLTQPRGEN
ncbi:MAG: hypothetical protein DDG59_05025 [Anaerolineae bacterium]|jgi:hypothetical protein|nr:MAG: hypothetical protein DDG59_05025 [Anaerolineae bacterium]